MKNFVHCPLREFNLQVIDYLSKRFATLKKKYLEVEERENGKTTFYFFQRMLDKETISQFESFFIQNR